jgi:hypothetical protein
MATLLGWSEADRTRYIEEYRHEVARSRRWREE